MELKDIYPAVLILIMIGILLGIGLYTMQEVRTNVATTQSGSGFTHGDVGINVTYDADNQTALTDSTKDNYVLLSVNVTNYTGNYQLIENTSTTSGNYSWTSDGTITWLGLLTAYDSYYVNITSTYTYDVADSPESAIQDTLEGVGDFADWVAIIVVVLAAAIVLGIVLRSFGARNVGV